MILSFGGQLCENDFFQKNDSAIESEASNLVGLHSSFVYIRLRTNFEHLIEVHPKGKKVVQIFLNYLKQF